MAVGPLFGGPLLTVALSPDFYNTEGELEQLRAALGSPPERPARAIDLTAASPTVRPLFMHIMVCDPVSPKGVALLQQRPEFKVTVLAKRLPEAELIPLVNGRGGDGGAVRNEGDRAR